jgi:PPOX class probable F420-dependent enzyme
MGVKERVGRAMDRVYDRLRHPDAFKLRFEDAVDGDFSALRGAKYGVVVTFRRTGQAVPSPVWFGIDSEGRAYVRTMRVSGKVQRIGNDTRALLAPSSVRGKPTGPVVRGVARVLPEEDWAHAEVTLAAAYGVGRKFYEGMVGNAEGLVAYIEITPHAPET